jgi:hypothetical protein
LAGLASSQNRLEVARHGRQNDFVTHNDVFVVASERHVEKVGVVPVSKIQKVFDRLVGLADWATGEIEFAY